MKKTIALLCFVPMVAMAQTTTSNSSATTRANSASNNAGNSQAITYNTPAGVEYGGSYSVKTTGTAILPAFAGSFSSDFCGSTAGAAGGGLGFAFSLGAPYIDESCVLLRSYERTMQAAAVMPDPNQAQAIREAGLEIISEVNPKVRAIFERKGLVLAIPAAPPIAKP